MMEFAELNPSNLTEEHISFILAPRLNASGRLADANQMVELLITTDISRARLLAVELEGLNAQRKLLTDQVYQAAQSQLEQQPNLLESPVIVLSHPSWPSGIIGIVASHLVEQYHRPVILFSTPPGSNARGSARSIDGVNITQAISLNQHLLKSFGGHPMAAGLSIDPSNISQLQKAINNTIRQAGVEIKKEKELHIDTYLTLSELNLSLVEDLERLAPFGPGNPPLVLAARNLTLTGYSAVGKNADHLQLTIEDELGYSHRSIWWQAAGFPLPEGPFDLACSVRASNFHGQRDIQIEWIDYRLPESSAISLQTKPGIEVIDYRHQAHPLDQVKLVQGLAPCITWGEAGTINELGCLNRNNLCPSDVLVIWTIPPGSFELQAAIHTTKPSKVYLFGIDPGMDDPGAFLRRLLGLLKFNLQTSNGKTQLSALAAASAQKVSSVKIGLKWLESQGHIRIMMLTEDHLQVQSGSASKQDDASAISNQLNSALTETAAFRRYYLNADKNRLLAFETALK
jgi:single-stranded-DNA-specific exonuclease